MLHALTLALALILTLSLNLNRVTLQTSEYPPIPPEFWGVPVELLSMLGLQGAKTLSYVFDYSTVVCCPSPGNPRKYPYKPYTATFFLS